MISGGYVLQPRCFDRSQASHFPPVARELWLYLLRMVNHKDNGKFSRGQGFFCLSDIQEDLSWHVGYRKEKYSKPQLTKALRRLREENMIETTKEIRGVFVTVCKYDFYQDPSNYEGNDEEIAAEAREQSSGHTKNKNVKNKNIKTIIQPEGVSEQSWSDLLSHRQKIKAPLTQRAVDTLSVEFKKASEQGYTVDQCIDEMCNRGWRGFKAEWMKGKVIPSSQGCSDCDYKVRGVCGGDKPGCTAFVRRVA